MRYDNVVNSTNNVARSTNNGVSSANKVVSSADNVWTILFRLLVQPPDGPMLRAMNMPKNLPTYKPDLTNALRLLKERGDQVFIMI